MESALKPITNSLRGFFSWWFGELAGFIPLRLRRAVAGTSQKLVLEFSAQEVIVGCDRIGKYRELGRIDRSLGEGTSQRRAMTKLTRKLGRGRADATIRLSGDKVLQKLIRLPLATEENLREVVGFEMNRHTPFKAGDVFYDYRIVERDDQAQQISVELAVAPKAEIEGVIKATRDVGLHAVSIEVAGDDAAQDQLFNLLPGDQAKGQARLGGRLSFILAMLALLLGALAVYIPIDRESREATRMLSRVAAAKAEANLAADLRDEINKTIEAGGFLAGKKHQTSANIELLAELTRLLPDDTSLLHFQRRDSSISMAGFSASASDLIGIIEQSPYFQDAEFRSIVSQDLEDGLERFQLSATIEGKPAP